MGIFISNPGKYVQSVYEGILLYSKTVLPSLFPFFFLTFLLTHIGGVKYLSGAFSPLARLYGLNRDSSFIILMSFLSGYPIGAKLTSDYFKDGIIDNKQAKTLCAVASTSGPVFIIGTVGAMMLSDPKTGALVYACHIMGALVNGLFFKGKTDSSAAIIKPEEKAENLLKDAVYSSVLSVLCVGGFIAVSSFIIEIFKTVGIISVFEKCLWFIKNDSLKEGIVVSLFEMTNGINVLSKIKDIRLLLPAVTFSVSFGGLSVLLQCYAYLNGCGISFKEFFFKKITGALTATVIAYLVSLLLSVF